MLDLERHKSILKYLHDKGEWIKGRELAEVFEVSDRTIRSDIITIKKMLGDKVILSSKGQGYLYNKEFDIGKFISNDKVLEPSDRLIYIAKKLIIYDDGINIYDLADELYISESTVTSDISRLKKIIDDTIKDNVELIRDGEKIRLIGEEYYKDCLLSRVIKSEKIYIQNDELEKFFCNSNVEKIVYIIIENLEKYKFTSRYISIMELTVHILLMIERSKLNIKNGLSKDNSLNLQKEIKIAESIIYDVENLVKINIEQEEIKKLAYALWCSSELQYEKFVINNITVDDKYMNTVIFNILTEIINEYDIDLTLDDEFIRDIALHTKIALKRVSKGIKIYNPIKEQMAAEHPFLFDIAIYLAKRISDYTGVLLNQEEISFLVAHIGVAVAKIKNQSVIRKKINVLLIVLEGKSTLKHIIKRITDSYDESILNIYSISSPYNIEEVLKEPVQYDIIMSTSKFTILNLKQDLLISPQFTIIDEINLRKIMTLKIVNMKLYNFEILFNKFFHEEIFFREENFDNKDFAIYSLCNSLEKNGYIDENFKNSVMEREELMSTALDSKVALPHPTNAKALKSGIAVLIQNKSIDWYGKRIKAVFLFSISKEDVKIQKEVYDFIVKLVSKEANIEEMLRCKSFNEFKSFLRGIYLS